MLLTIFARDLALEIGYRANKAGKGRLNGESGALSPGRSEPHIAPERWEFCHQTPPGERWTDTDDDPALVVMTAGKFKRYL